MALFTFGNQTGPIPLSQLDFNFQQPVQLANVANTVSNPVQANITTLGQLTGLSATGNIIATGNISTSTSLLSTGNIITTANVNARSMFIDNSGFANAVITGNLTVQGNLNSVGATNISTGNLTITLGNAILANNSVALNGAGIIVGATPTATFLYNFGTSSFQSSIDLLPISTVLSLNLGNTTNQWRSLFAANVFLTGNMVAGNIQSNNYSATNITATGDLAVSGNIATAGGVSVAGNIIADGNIVGDIVASSVSVTGTVTVGAVTASGNLVAAGITVGNATMANIGTGNVLNSGNISTIGVSASGNIVGGNLTVAGAAFSQTAANGTNNTQLATTAFVRSIVPTGVILMWYGSVATIPAGWLLCNGTNGTPNLLDRFIVGAGSGYAVAATGGSANATLPSHSHTASSISTVADPGHAHPFTLPFGPVNTSYSGGGQGLFGGGNYGYATDAVATGITVSTSTTVDATGASPTNANLPPYYALCYIMKA